jgi:GntR family transcriptional regulator, vanillate catabolism transcriptional regulator
VGSNELLVDDGVRVAERLGVSRMPVRMAFRTLEQEGLLTKQPHRGYRVREVTADEISGSIEVRGVLEGLTASQAAQKGLSEAWRQELVGCLRKGDALFAKGYATLFGAASEEKRKIRVIGIQPMRVEW